MKVRRAFFRGRDHRIVVEPASEGGTRYTDRVSIEAGIMTAPVAVFANGFCAQRQRRLRRLAKLGLERFLPADR